MAVLATISTAFSFLVGGIDTPIKYFLILTAADYVTGLIAAWRTCTLSSAKAFDGIKRKFIILAVVVLANLIDGAAGLGHILRGAADSLESHTMVMLLSELIFCKYKLMHIRIVNH